MKLIREHFNSITEMLDIINARPKNKIMKRLNSSHTNDYDFCKTHNYNEAVELLLNGYDEILDQIKLNVKVNFTSDSREKSYNDVYGFCPNVPLSIMNLPKSMINSKKIPRKTSTINLIYCPVATGDVHSKIFINNGIKILNIVNSLERNNIRIKLSVGIKCSKTSDNEEYNLVTVTIKNYMEKLNLKKICFPIAHPSMLRRFGFKWLETSPDITNENWSLGYGRSIYSGDELTDNLEKSTILIVLNEIIHLNEEEILNKIKEKF